MSPQRQTVKKIDSVEVQGEGSYVVLTGVKVSEMRKMRKSAEDKDFDHFQGGLDLIAKHIQDWNWVDDDGNPLALPANNPEVIDDLTDEESKFLAGLLIGTETAKN